MLRQGSFIQSGVDSLGFRGQLTVDFPALSAVEYFILFLEAIWKSSVLI